MLHSDSIQMPIIIAEIQVPSFFLTNNTGEAKGLLLGLITPWANICFNCFSISDFYIGEYLYGLTFTGYAPGIKGILWSTLLDGGRLTGSENRWACLDRTLATLAGMLCCFTVWSWSEQCCDTEGTIIWMQWEIAPCLSRPFNLLALIGVHTFGLS